MAIHKVTSKITMMTDPAKDQVVVTRDFNRDAFRVSGEILREASQNVCGQTIDKDICHEALRFAATVNQAIRADMIGELEYCDFDETTETLFLSVPNREVKSYFESAAVSEAAVDAMNRYRNYNWFKRIVFVLQGNTEIAAGEMLDDTFLGSKDVPFGDIALDAIVHKKTVSAVSNIYRTMAEYGERFMVTEAYKYIAAILTVVLGKKYTTNENRCICIVGPRQSGKTHLLTSIGAALSAKNDRGVIYKDWGLLCMEANAADESEDRGKYMQFKKQFAGRHLLIDDIYGENDDDDEKPISGSLYSVIRNSLYSGGHLIATFRDENQVESFLKGISCFYPDIEPLYINLPKPPPEHCAAVIRDKVAYAHMTINEMQYQAIEELGKFRFIPHSYQLADMLTNANKESLFGLICTDDDDCDDSDGDDEYEDMAMDFRPVEYYEYDDIGTASASMYDEYFEEEEE